MAFFDLNNNQINIQQFINTYEHYYYLNTPNVGRRITRRNKSNQFIENNIQNILIRGLNQNDLIFVIAWKIGAIDHVQSNNAIIYRQNFNNTLNFQTQFNIINVNHLVQYIINNFNQLINMVNNPQLLFQTIFQNRRHNSYFGLVYCLTLVYFFTQGQYPIYDKYAHIALHAYQNNIPPNNRIVYNQINDWLDYNQYSNSLSNIFGNHNIPRNIDRSLWVYGHFFNP